MFLFYDLEKSRFGSRLHGDCVYTYWDLGTLGSTLNIAVIGLSSWPAMYDVCTLTGGK